MANLHISAVACRAGVTPDTIRFYERRGVLPQPLRGDNGYRIYSVDTIERIQLIRRAVAVGFTLDELARVLRVRDRGGMPCREVRSIAANRLQDIKRRLDELRELERILEALLAEWDVTLAQTPHNRQARLLDSLRTS